MMPQTRASRTSRSTPELSNTASGWLKATTPTKAATITSQFLLTNTAAIINAAEKMMILLS